MLKKNITYETFDGDEVTETFYFHMSRTELIDLEVGEEGGMQKALQKIIDEKNPEKLVKEFQKWILLSYGKKSDDGKSFIKSDELREAFKQTAAYDALFMELSTVDDAAVHFFQGIMPFKVDVPSEAPRAVAPPLPPTS